MAADDWPSRIDAPKVHVVEVLSVRAWGVLVVWGVWGVWGVLMMRLL